jgi:diaminohydroxyphosphoribosylaminopyrimidine deaminase / 5-amino-6-(5-phosphoribosylamino)uracil reductase
MDEQFMARALQLAHLGQGQVAPNPMVGAVIVRNGKIIGEGWHARYGEAHAEVNAVRSLSAENLQHCDTATIYVTLEPCHHYGKTPPCVDLILKHRFARVVIGCQDPNPQVGGKSIEKLRQNGVVVTVGVLERECEHLARRFMTFFTKKRPYIILKFAQSADGFIGRTGEQVKITNALTQRLVHRWRSEEAAILVGTNTAITDNPTLTNRLWSGGNPLRLVIDTKNRLSPNANLRNADAPTVIYNTSNLQEILADLYTRKINSVIVEGGAALLQSFINADLWDEARILTGKKTLQNGIKAPEIPAHLRTVVEERSLDGDKLIVFSRG